MGPLGKIELAFAVAMSACNPQEDKMATTDVGTSPIEQVASGYQEYCDPMSRPKVNGNMAQFEGMDLHGSCLDEMRARFHSGTENVCTRDDFGDKATVVCQ